MNQDICLLFFASLRFIFKGTPFPEEAGKLLTEENGKKLLALSKSQDLAHLVSYALYNAGLLPKDSPLFPYFQKEQFKAVFRYERFSQELSHMKAVFTEAGMPFLPLKGSVTRNYYPEPWMRTSCDTDILIPEDRLEEGVKLLQEKLNYTPAKERGFHDISLYSPSDAHLELHFNLLETDPNLDRVLTRVWDYTRPKEVGGFEYEMTPEYFMFHTVAHMAHHFSAGGSGVRTFLDLWILEKNFPFDREKLDALLEEAEISVFYTQAKALARYWLEGGESTPLLSDMQNYIFKGGVYGSWENQSTVLQNNAHGNTFLFLLKRMFLPYKSLKNAYPRLAKHKILYPYYTVKRWFRLLFSRDVKGTVKKINIAGQVTEEAKSTAKNLFRELGLSDK